MKEIVIISGKGGTGKTSVTASFAVLGGKNIVTADCDVDAADMHLLLDPDFGKAEDFYSGQIAVIDQDKCTNCGKCAEICRYNAIPFENEQYVVKPLDCEGCGYCARICPENAITNIDNNVGQWIESNIKTGTKMVHAKMKVGAENSGKLVAKVKREAKRIAEEENIQLVLVDGSPGVGCPVVSSLSGANYVILVTEPSVSGLHDLIRVYELVEKFKIKAGCIINKADINKEKAGDILKFLKEKNIDHIANLPYDEMFTAAMTAGKTIVEFGDSEIKEILEKSWNKILKI